ncbi:hypothetical protein KSF73_10830 [Burkholderiaceae bacterium DAT-1]|nr:hypothetical protein [Burkholderiaceae bacterium DAT-1]
MTIVYEKTTNDFIDLATFHHGIETIAHERFSREYVDECARLLGLLGNHPDLFWGLFEKMDQVDDIGKIFNAPQSFYLSGSDSHYLRLNIWLPQSGQPYESFERELYSYQLAHNHDFRLLTVGYAGPGYWTDLYEIPASDIQNKPGKMVQLNHHRREQLTQGKVLYFDSYHDVHVQHYPESLSISVNLIFRNEVRPYEQILVDTGTGVVQDYPALSAGSRAINVLKMFALASPQPSNQAVQAIADTHKVERVRAFAATLLKPEAAHV